MEWRCEWCGKPHEEDDPPCDNCGHGSFEKAVVQKSPEAERPDETTVWVCTECGRTHTKHTPPCSRCGNHKLVRERQRVGDDELAAPSYFDLLTPRYALGLVAVVGLAVLFVLGLTGVVPLPGFGSGVPTVDGVPGDADGAGNVSLSDVERAYLDAVNAAREDAGTATLTRTADLDEVATFITRRAVKADYTDDGVRSRERVREVIDSRCDGGYVVGIVTVGSVESADAATLGEALAAKALSDGRLTEQTGAKTGIDAHTAPDGTVYLSQVVC